MAGVRQTRFIFVTGGVLSGLGKGITAASLGALFISRGYRVNAQKLDPYLNVDAGTLNPGEHGECFVTDDGAETDLDLGHYERFLDRNLTQSSSVMSGRILRQLIDDERAGKYLGKTVQLLPHFTEAIEKRIVSAAKGYDIHIVEIGGTVGDYESPAFFEAIRSLSSKIGQKRVCNVQVVYLPYLATSNEIKTKPAQNATKDLRALGIVPDVLIGRSDHAPRNGVVSKLAQMTGVNIKGITVLVDADTIYRVPLMLNSAGIDGYILKRLGLKDNKPNLRPWQDLVKRSEYESKQKFEIALVAKYMSNEDTYYSVSEAIKAAAWATKRNVKVTWVDAEKLTKLSARKILAKFNGIIVPGGFGARGIEGKIVAASYAMKNKVPYLGLCLGLQVAVIAASRDRLNLKNANSLEVDPITTDPVIYIMKEQIGKPGTGGTMRLGSYPCQLKPGSLARRLYKEPVVHERHRHRYEVNNLYRQRLEKVGLIASGIYGKDDLVEIIELKYHPFFIASQFHPELKSRPMRPHPLFKGFVAALQKLLS